jgi:hypothetical protein
MRWYVCVKLEYPRPRVGDSISGAREQAVRTFFKVTGSFTDRECYLFDGTRPRPFGGTDPAPDEQPWDWAGPE